MTGSGGRLGDQDRLIQLDVGWNCLARSLGRGFASAEQASLDDWSSNQRQLFLGFRRHASPAPRPRS